MLAKWRPGAAARAVALVETRTLACARSLVVLAHANYIPNGLVKSVGIDHPDTMELVSFGDSGAVSEIP